MNTLVLMLLGAAITGCGSSGPTTYPISGVVTFENKPLTTGSMTFIPQVSSARTTVAKIVDGRYETELTEGAWTVNIQAVRETGPVIPELKEAPREQYIPAKYNRQSTLTVSMPTDKGERKFDLEL